ncbi:MAG: sugar ABC transporter substrate-binding protein [Candidatus Omnitrophica bacterium]|nr:sugar ABC transporter substrate-binding protein [Candidatus Omnitrophota bacterium]
MTFFLRRIQIFVLSVLCIALIGGCADDAGQDGESAETGRLIGVSFQSMNNPFFVDLNEGLREIIESHGDRLVTLDAQWNSLKQKNDISDLVMQGAAAIFINPVNWEGVKGSLIEAKQKKIPCIVVDAPVKDKDLVLSIVASDNIEAGRLAARKLADVRRPAKIAVLEQSINKACIDRVAGFLEVLQEFPDMEIVDKQEVRGTTESSRPVMRDIIGRNPGINAVFSINDPTALGAVSALESAGKLADVKIVAVDGAQEALKAILAGKMLATSAQFPKEIGIKAAETLYTHFSGQPVEKEIKVRVALIDAENADQYLKDE